MVFQFPVAFSFLCVTFFCLSVFLCSSHEGSTYCALNELTHFTFSTSLNKMPSTRDTNRVSRVFQGNIQDSVQKIWFKNKKMSGAKRKAWASIWRINYLMKIIILITWMETIKVLEMSYLFLNWVSWWSSFSQFRSFAGKTHLALS